MTGRPSEWSNNRLAVASQSPTVSLAYLPDLPTQGRGTKPTQRFAAAACVARPTWSAIAITGGNWIRQPNGGRPGAVGGKCVQYGFRPGSIVIASGRLG